MPVNTPVIEVMLPSARGEQLQVPPGEKGSDTTMEAPTHTVDAALIELGVGLTVTDRVRKHPVELNV
jgi:hypothetical protein